jgi:hypothetical protein
MIPGWGPQVTGPSDEYEIAKVTSGRRGGRSCVYRATREACASRGDPDGLDVCIER